MTQSLRLRTVTLILAPLLPIAVAVGIRARRVFGDRLVRDIDVALERRPSPLAERSRAARLARRIRWSTVLARIVSTETGSRHAK